MLKNQKGFLLINIIFIMLLMAVSIFSINYYSTTQIQIASNHADSLQTGYDLNAVSEHSLWKLTKNLFWRTDAAGEDTTYNGTIYERIALNANDDALFEGGTAPSSLDDYDDAVTVRVTPKGSDQHFQRSFRYYASELELSGYSLNHPERIFMMPTGKLLIADKDNFRVIEVDPDTSAVTIIAGTGSKGDDGEGWYYGSDRPELDKPKSMCTTPSGSTYYIADTDNDRVLRGYYWGFGWWRFYETVGADTLKRPNDVLRDTSNGLYIADTDNHCIRKVNVDDTDDITIVAGKEGQDDFFGDEGPATDAKLDTPRGICLDNHGNLFIADTKNNRIRKVDTNGDIWTVVGTGAPGNTGDGGPATDAKLNRPVDVTVDDNGNIFIVDKDSRRIRVVNALDGNIYTLAGSVDGDTAGLPAVEAKIKKSAGIAMASSYGGNRIYISDRDNHKIKVLLLKPVYGL